VVSVFVEQNIPASAHFKPKQQDGFHVVTCSRSERRSSMSNKLDHARHTGHFLKHAAQLVKGLKPLREQKNPVAAFFLGFLLGVPGLALYLGSWKDLFICVGLLIAFIAVMPWGPGELLGWTFVAVYGAYRVRTSNEKLQEIC
jgi:hypothetical protein